MMLRDLERFVTKWRIFMTNRIEKAEYPIQITTNAQKVVFPDEILHKNDPRLQDHTGDAVRYCIGPLESTVDKKGPFSWSHENGSTNLLPKPTNLVIKYEI